MEKLSINSSKKTLLAVALVIFMLVAFLGLAVLSSTGTFASATTYEVSEVSAVFSANSATAHGDSTTTKLYYNQLAANPDSDLDFPLAVNDTFTVDYTVNTTAIEGFEMDLYNVGFQVTGITVGSTALAVGNSYSYYDSTNKITYTATSGFEATISNGVSSAKVSRLIVDVESSKSSYEHIYVTYKLTEAIATYSHKNIVASLEYWSNTASDYETVTSAAVGVYVRSTASITTTSPGKTYDATAATTSTTFTPAVSDAGSTENRSAIVTTWSSGSAPIDAGDYNIAVSTAANDYYEQTSYNTDFTIAKKSITITADDKTSVYSTTPVALSYTASPIDFYGRDSVTVTYTGAGSSISTATTVGEYTITPVASHANYTITPVNGTYTVTRHNIAVPTVTIYNDGSTTDTTIAAGTTEEKTFNGKAYTFNYTVDPTDANSIAKYTSTGGASITAVGTSTLTLTVNSNYYWGDEGVAVGSQDTEAKTFTIKVNKANITVTLHHDAIQYLDAVPTANYYITAAECLFGEDVSTVVINQADFSTEYTVGAGLGTYDIELANTNGSKTAIEAYLSNYNVSYTGEDQLTVGAKHISVAANWIDWASGDSATMTYDKAAHGIVAVPANYTYASTVICDVAFSGGDSAEGAKQTHVNGNELATTLTATFTVKSTGNDGNGNAISTHYVLDTTSTSKDITINRKAVTITAADKSTTYGSAAPAFTSDAGSVLISGDTYSTTGSITCAYTATAGNANRVVGTYDIVPSGWANNDYAISYTNGTLTVNKKTVSITWSATKSWVYDATSHTITATIGDTEYSESLSVTAYGDDASGTNVGDYTRSVTTISDMANYALPADVDEDYEITAKVITVTVTPTASLVYNADDQVVFTVTVAGLIGDEDLTFAYTNTNLGEGTSFKTANGSVDFEAELAQSYAIKVTAISNGDDGLAANYSFTPAADSTENSIAKYTFTWAAATYNKATASWSAPTTIQGEDSISFTYSLKLSGDEMLASNTATSYTATATGVYTLSVSFTGTKAANYNAIDAQTLNTVYSVSLTDDLANHSNEGPAFSTVTQYAFSGQTINTVADWELSGYDFEGWFVDLEDEETEINFSAAVTATKTYIAKWSIKSFTVIYKYRLAGTAGWSTYLEEEGQDVIFYNALATAPTKVWFSGTGWKDNSSLTGDSYTTMTIAADTTFYAEYSYAIGNGDVDGDKDVDTSDATLLRQHLAGGYANVELVSSISAAWAISDAAGTAAKSYVLGPSANVDGDGRVFATDVTAINKAIATGYGYVISNGAVVKALSTDDGKNFAIGTGYTILSVTVAGEAAEYTYTSGTLTLNTALTSGQTIVIKTTRATVQTRIKDIENDTTITYTYSDTALTSTYTKS